MNTAGLKEREKVISKNVFPEQEMVFRCDDEG